MQVPRGATPLLWADFALDLAGLKVIRRPFIARACRRRHDLAVGLHGLGMPPDCPRVMQGCRASSSWPLEARFAHAPELLVLPDGTVVLPLQLVDLMEAR